MNLALSFEKVTARLDGRTFVWLSRELQENGVRVSVQSLSNYKTHYRTPSQETLTKIREILSAQGIARRLKRSSETTPEAADAHTHTIPRENTSSSFEQC
jgi:hypothetical protein